MANNRQVLLKLIHEADDFQLVFIRERLLTVCDAYADAEQVRKEWSAPFISPDLYIESARKTKAALDFKEYVCPK